jgi:D-serine dehydratase
VHQLQDASAAPADWRITALNDQHAYLQFDPQGTVPAVGDRVALGISHPCTTFDKWRWLALVEDDGAISGAVRTCF